MAISGVSVAISQKRYTIWPSALLHTNRKCDSPIIQVFPVLNTFAKFQRGPPVIRGHRIQVGYINLVMLQPRRGVSRNQGCHKCFFQWKTIKPWQTIPHEFYAGGRRRFRPPLARCGNRWPSQTRNQGCHKGFFLVKKYPLAKKKQSSVKFMLRRPLLRVSQMSIFSVKNYPKLKFILAAASSTTDLPYTPPWKLPPPCKFAVLTVSALLTRDLFAIGKFRVPTNNSVPAFYLRS